MESFHAPVAGGSNSHSCRTELGKEGINCGLNLTEKDIMSRPKPISKSAFVKGTICQKAFWLNRTRPFEESTDPVKQHLLEEGRRIGELARQYFGNGVLIAEPPWEKEKAIETTQVAVQANADLLY